MRGKLVVNVGEALLPVGRHHFGPENVAIGSVGLAVALHASTDVHTHVVHVISDVEGKDDTIRARRVLTRTIALLVTLFGLKDLCRHMMEIHHLRRQMRNWISVMGHAE